MEDKLSNFKKEIGERHVNQFIAELLKEKNFYQAQYEGVAKNYLAFQQQYSLIGAKCPEAQELLQECLTENGKAAEELVGSLYKAQQVV